MLPLVLLLALSLPQAEVDAFARRVAQTLAQSQAPGPHSRVQLQVEDAGGVGGAGQLARALHEALLLEGFEPMAGGKFGHRVFAYLSLRRGRPLAAVRILGEGGEGKEVAVLFAEFSPGAAPEPIQPEGPPVTIRTRTLLATELPVLDLEADRKGNLFVLHPDRLVVFDLNAVGLPGKLPVKAVVELDTGADRLRDPLVRLLAHDSPRRLELYSAAETLAPAPPQIIEGYTLRSLEASALLRVSHPWRAVSLQFRLAAGRNFLYGGPVTKLYGLAPVRSPLRAHWVLLDGTGRLVLTDASLRPISIASGPFGGDVASAALPCTGTLVMAAGPEPHPLRDRISVLRVENDRLLPFTSLAMEGAVRRLKTLAPVGKARRILAVVQTNAVVQSSAVVQSDVAAQANAAAQANGATRIEEIELRCSP